MPTKNVARETYFSDLMQRSIAGDQRAYRELLRSIRIVLLVYARGFLMRMGKRDKSTAEDVVQDILVAIHQKRHTYDPALPVLSWVFAIARYKLIDFGRRERRTTTGLEGKDLDTLPAKDLALDPEIKHELDELLNELSEPARKALELVKLEGLTIEEASAELSMSPSAVKVSIHRSLKTLNKIWATRKNS